MKLGRRAVLHGSAGALIMAPAIVSGQAPARLTLDTTLPEASFHTVNCRRFAAEVRKATGGAVEIDVKSGGQLGFTGAESLRAVRDGLVPLASYLDLQQVGDEPFLGIGGLPFLAGSAGDLKILQKHIRPGYDEVAARNNQTILYVVPWPGQYLHLKARAETADALKGVKIRAADKSTQEMLAMIGMAPVVIPWVETRPVLASGAVSGVSTSAVSAADGKLWEFLKFFHATYHQWSAEIVAINSDAFRRIGADHRRAIADIARKLEPEFWDKAFQQDKDGAAKLTEAGMTRVAISDGMLADLRKRTAPIVDGFMKRVPSSRAPIEAYLAELKRT
ncbi:MAG: TRAP transporter substrate-binding protein [Enhydrobacter sp.]|nr:TRAP transporter substrate-binding protein [Enhydrobacter sp.]